MPRHQSRTPSQALAAALLGARTGAGKTQEQAAAALNVDPSTIGNWESARTEPKPSQVLSLGLFYGVPPSTLFRALDPQPAGTACNT